MKKVARTSARRSSSRMRSAVPGGAPGRSGCSASNVSATRARSLTTGHLRRAKVHARVASALGRERSSEQLDRYQRYRRAERAVGGTDGDGEGAGRHIVVAGDHGNRGAGAYDVLCQPKV